MSGHLAPAPPTGAAAIVMAGLDAAARRLGELLDSFVGMPGELAALIEHVRAMSGDADALRAVSYGLILLLVGGGVEWLYWCYAGAVRRGAETREPRSPVHAAGAGLIRAALDLGGVALFAVAVLAVSAGFDWPAGVQAIVVALALGLAALRGLWAMARLLLSPRSARLRLVDLGDAAARRLHALLVAASGAIVVLGFAASVVHDALGLAQLAIVLRFVAASAVAALLVAAVLVPARARTDAEATTAEHRSEALRRFAAVAGLLLCYLIWIAGFDRLAWSAIVVVAFVIADWIARHVVDRIAAAGAEGRLVVYRTVVHRGLRLLLAGVGGLALAAIWGFQLSTLGDPAAPGARIAGGLISVAVTLLLADLCWSWARTAIDHQMTRNAAAAASPGAVRRLDTLLPLLRKFLIVVLAVIVVLTTLSALGIEIGPLLAGAGIVGIAIGFGSQTLVKDIISGLFFLLDDAFRVGEYIESGSTRGTVESFSLRSVKLRHHRGALHTVPFGELRSITNYSRDWVIDKLTFGVTYDTDLDKVKKIIKQVSKDLMADEELAPHILEPLKSQGVSEFGDFAIQLRLKIKTVPGEQFVIRRTIYDKLKKSFAASGVKFAFPTVTVENTGDASGAAARAALESL